MKVLYVASEALPFAASGGLADVAGSLPKAIRSRLVGCRVVMPLYESISQEWRDKMTFLTSLSVPVAWRRQYCGVFEAKVDGVIYYLLDNQYYFKRQGLYGHYDDAERFAFFSRAVLEMLPHIGFKPDVIHDITVCLKCCIMLSSCSGSSIASTSTASALGASFHFMAILCPKCSANAISSASGLPTAMGVCSVE